MQDKMATKERMSPWRKGNKLKNIEKNWNFQQFPINFGDCDRVAILILRIKIIRMRQNKFDKIDCSFASRY